MALRLVQPAGGPAPLSPPPPTPAAAPSGGSPLASMVHRATALLRARDLKGWRAMVDGAGALPDVHERYVVRKVLLEQVLGLGDLPPVQLAEAYAAAADAALAVLDEEPREPLVLNIAGVLLYELGALAGAEALFKGAERLDPELPHLERNLREVRRRRKANGGPPRGLPPKVLRDLRTLGPKAESIAARAVPATGMTLSLCMIVKDEEAMLPRCLAAVRDAVDEIIVVDTGSTDRTVEIAESFGAKVLHHEWTGDFAAARNVSFDAATSDWMMFLDADEVLVEGDAPRLRALTGKVWREALFLTETNHTGDIEDGTSVTHDAMRIFRNRPEYRFNGRIHEQIAHRLPDLPERLERTDVRIEHFGYLGAVRDAKGKSRRNIELLQKQVAEGGDSPFLHFNLGSEHSAAGEHEDALKHFRLAWQRLDHQDDRTKLGFFPSLCSRYVKTLAVCGHHDEAIAAGDEVLELLPGFTDIVFQQACSHQAKGDLDTATAMLETCLEMGDAPSRYSAAVGAGSFLALVQLAGVHAARGDADAAREALRRCLEVHPGFIGAIDPYTRLLLRSGLPAAEAAEQVRALAGAAGPIPPGGRFLLAVPLYEAGAVEEAERELRAVLEAQPHAHAARLALAEALLSQARYDDAIAEADRVPVEAPIAPGAARTALFCHLVKDERDDAALDAALARARAADLDPAELTAFEAWRAGGAPAGSVPGEAMNAVAMMLEALARLEEFDAFERLAGVAEALALPWRERRELLAAVYLRRGFLVSAADEWIAVVERKGPDARAMRGLAIVAERQGLEDDARTFREEAAALEAAA